MAPLSKTVLPRTLLRGLAMLAAGLLSPGCLTAGADTIMTPKQSPITRITYRGWPDSYALPNGFAEAVVVPALGRIMQFRFAGEPDGRSGRTPRSQRTRAIGFSRVGQFRLRQGLAGSARRILSGSAAPGSADRLKAGGRRTYPDGGSAAEIYTNAAPQAYVELELLGPLAAEAQKAD